jgi:hypothetical protein
MENIRMFIRNQRIYMGMGKDEVAKLLGPMSMASKGNKIYQPSVWWYGNYRLDFTKHTWRQPGHAKLIGVVEVLL